MQTVCKFCIDYFCSSCKFGIPIRSCNSQQNSFSNSYYKINLRESHSDNCFVISIRLSQSVSGSQFASYASFHISFSIYKNKNFVINRFFTKLFKTSNIHIVSNCQEQFIFALPQLARRAEKFLNKLHVH